MNDTLFCKSNKIFFLNIIVLAIVSEAWIISVNGCAWNENIVVYTMIILFSVLIKDTNFFQKIEKKYILIPLAIAGTVTLIFSLGVIRWNISGEIIISHLNAKMVLVFAGYYFIATILLQRLRMVNVKRAFLVLIYGITTAVVFSAQGIISTRSVAGWVMGIALFFCINQSEIHHNYFGSKREKYIYLVLALLFSIIYVLVNFFEWRDRLESPIKLIGLSLFTLLILSVMFGISLRVIFESLMKLPVYVKSEKSHAGKMFIMYMVSLIAVWIPYFLVWFPGILSHDSISQMEQVMGVEAYSNHHPWLHTLLIQVCVNLGMKVGGDINFGVACYSMFSMIFMAFSAACGLMWLRKKGAVKWLRYINWCFWAVFPINAVYMITMWKDIIFAGIVLLFLLVLDYLIQKKETKGKLTSRCFVLFGILSFGVCFFRSNGLYAWLFMLIFLFFHFRREKKLLCQLGITVGLVLLASGFYKGIVLPAFQVSEPDFIESLSIPSQQIACVLNKGGIVTPEEYEILNEVVDTKKVAQDYKTYISDPVKYLVREKNNQDYLKENIKDYVKVYISIGLRNPLLYLQGFVEQTKGYWYHKVNNWIYYPDGVRENELGIFQKKLLPEKICLLIENILEKTEEFYHKFFSIALSSWMVLLGIGYSWMNKRTPIMFILQLGIILTLLIATPVSAEFRYMYAVFWSLPVIWAGTLCDLKRE